MNSKIRSVNFDEMEETLSPTCFIDFHDEVIQKLVRETVKESMTDLEKAKILYEKVREDWRYNPYRISLNKSDYRASYFAAQTEGHCIAKSVILMAALRAVNIPSKLVLAKVKNHIAVEVLTERLGTNEIAPHGYVSVFLNDKWVKCSPAFNSSLCDMYGVDVLDFDGENDSIFQEHNKDGEEFMEYLEVYGEFNDLPLEFIIEIFRTTYPGFEPYFENGRLDITKVS